MLRAFLRHHLQRATLAQIPNAIANCHAVGLHSIMLHDEPGNRIRMFVATADHQLIDAEGNAALAVHAHHCDVRLQRIFGRVTNHSYSNIQPRTTGRYEACAYSSGVTGDSALRGTGMRCDFGSAISWQIQETIWLSAKQLHTVTVPPREQAAWLVFEGAEDPEYEPECYSLAPEKFDPAPLYKPMKTQDIETYLTLCLLRVDAEEKVAWQ